METIKVDMALAYQQMAENPELLQKFSELIQATMPHYEEAFSGWAVRSRYRRLDANGNPETEWSSWRYRSASRSTNPYVYQKGKHCAQTGIKESVIYSMAGQPARDYNLRYGTPEYNAWLEEYRLWSDNRPIVGYNQHEIQVVPAKIVVEV